MTSKMSTNDSEQRESFIRIAAAPLNDVAGTRGILETAGSKLNAVAFIASDKLAENLRVFSEQFGRALSAVASVKSEYGLDEVKVSVELSVEGEVTLIGSGASASGKAGLELVFKREKPQA